MDNPAYSQNTTVCCTITVIYSEQWFELLLLVVIFLVSNVSVFRPSDQVAEQYVTMLTLHYDYAVWKENSEKPS